MGKIKRMQGNSIVAFFMAHLQFRIMDGLCKIANPIDQRQNFRWAPFESIWKSEHNPIVCQPDKYSTPPGLSRNRYSPVHLSVQEIGKNVPRGPDTISCVSVNIPLMFHGAGLRAVRCSPVENGAQRPETGPCSPPAAGEIGPLRGRMAILAQREGPGSISRAIVQGKGAEG